MIKLTFEGNSLEEVFGSMRKALGDANPKDLVIDGKEVAKAMKKPVEKKEPVAPKKKPVKEEKPVEKEEVTKPSLTLEVIHKMTSEKAQEVGKSKGIKKLLAELNVDKVIKIPEDKFEWYAKQLEAL